MSRCCGAKNESPVTVTSTDPCCPPEVACAGHGDSAVAVLSPRFAAMVENNLEYAEAARAAGRPIVGIMCEFTPREIILAAGALPVCLCGGSADTIPAAEEELPGMLCPLIKSTYGYLVTKENPFLEMAALVVAETTCDGKKKMYELMAERIPMHLVELPQRENSPEAFALWLAELRRLRAALEERFGVQITDDKLREAIRTMNRERQSRMSLAGLLKQDCPPITGRQLLELKSLISGNPEDLAEYDRLLALLVEAKGPAELAGRTRVLLTGVPLPHGAERVMDLIEESGGLIVAQENCTGIKPLVEMVDEEDADPLAAIARKYFHLPCSVMTPNLGRFDLLKQLVAEYRPDCVIEVVWQACLTYDVEAVRVKRLAHELGLAYLRINTDYSPSDSARIAIRIEALFETVQHNRQRAGGRQA